MAPGGTPAAGQVPPRAMGGQRLTDARVRATKEVGEVEEGVGVEVVDEEESAFLYGWTEREQEGQVEGRAGDAEVGMMEEEEQLWKAEVVVVGMEVVVEELMEDQG